jgi:ethanolamine utilization microcompartment shell protein EutS
MMADEKRYLVITPDKVAVSVLNPERDVGVHLDLDPGESGLLGIEVVVRMTPTESRRIAALITRKADEAEAKLPRA